MIAIAAVSAVALLACAFWVRNANRRLDALQSRSDRLHAELIAVENALRDARHFARERKHREVI
jgi:hypothetical protein